MTKVKINILELLKLILISVVNTALIVGYMFGLFIIAYTLYSLPSQILQ